ncbi:lytR cell envelope-related transcriptional attenuator family protein [Rhodococcus sp. MTM3W5.2]|uniref:envelope integrity protein Cei n=1 Tax=Rhodococcus sp. MTM3W5.2 TaxID=1805827 RepID=UPI0009791F1C|nr:envelope integrity protein Cei [Rhodococcus sp. MTM3W5.2]AQA23412.1 lytR cell envelope-related transcriptional attenuator family protein [Rhodococcus sp. MTM3W5.2]
MVSLITQGHSTDEQGRPFRRRRAMPVVVLIGILALLGSVLWVRILTKDEEVSAAVTCNLPRPASQSADPNDPAPQPLGQKMDPTTLMDVEPTTLAATRVRVFNANGERGQAAQVAAQLSEYGYASAPDVQVGNDPVYIDQNMQCHGQIRFGANGLAAASALWLVAPCAELIEDQRQDDTVDLALGTYFNELRPNTDAEEVLAVLKEPAPGGMAAAPVDISLLKAARTARC